MDAPLACALGRPCRRHVLSRDRCEGGTGYPRLVATTDCGQPSAQNCAHPLCRAPAFAPTLLAWCSRSCLHSLLVCWPMTYDCDVLILGGRCAGLSLAAALTEARSSLRVRILEPRSEYKRDRTWCFWNTAPHPFEACVTHRWNSWSISKGFRRVIRSSSQYAYEHIQPTGSMKLPLPESRAARLKSCAAV